MALCSRVVRFSLWEQFRVRFDEIAGRASSRPYRADAERRAVVLNARVAVAVDFLAAFVSNVRVFEARK